MMIQLALLLLWPIWPLLWLASLVWDIVRWMRHTDGRCVAPGCLRCARGSDERSASA